MTKVQAIIRVLEDHNGIATWKIIYDEIEKYYPTIKSPKDWEAALRGVLYRELYANRYFKKIGIGNNSMIALLDYKEEGLEDVKDDVVRMHSFMEGICIDVGNFLNMKTYTADPSALYNKLALAEIATLPTIPEFTYPEIIDIAKRIDVLWFNEKGYQFPKRAIEVVDSIGTLEPSLKRSLQLKEFDLSFYILCKKEHVKKVHKELSYEPYVRLKDRYKVRDYESILELYNNPMKFSQDDFFKINSYY